MRKGDVALIVSALLYAAGWIVYLNFNAHAGEVIRMAGEASLIGGLCDYIALKMLFERKWYLPNSGVLPRNRVRIIQGIGNTVENEWLTPDMIHRKLIEYDLVTKVGQWLEQVSLRDADLAFIEEQALRLAEWLKRPEVVDRIVEELRKLLEIGPLLRIVERLLVNFEGKLREFAENLPELVAKFSHDPEFLNYLEGEIHRLGVRLQTADSTEREHVLRWVEEVLNIVGWQFARRDRAAGGGKPEPQDRRANPGSDRIQDSHASRMDPGQWQPVRSAVRIVRGVPAQLHPVRTVRGVDAQLRPVQITLARRFLEEWMS